MRGKSLAKPVDKFTACKVCGGKAHIDADKVVTWVDKETELCNECSKR